MAMKLELVIVPVSDVDRALAFYRDGLGFVEDHDVRPAEGVRVVQLTPPESLDLPGALTGPDGAGIDRHANAEKYTTQAVLDAETATLEAAHTPVASTTERARTSRSPPPSRSLARTIRGEPAPGSGARPVARTRVTATASSGCRTISSSV